MNHTQIIQLIESSLLEIYRCDPELLDRRVKEECINHRLAYYFETLFSQIIQDDMPYVVDLEYDKNLDLGNKMVTNLEGQPISIRPDVIIHKRTNHGDNLLAVEAKKEYLLKADKNKLEKLLLHPFYYQFTVGISYFPNRTYFRYQVYRLVNGNIEIEHFTLAKTTGN
jgi:hypothetical protein